MANIFTRKDRGQAVVLVAIIMVAMVAMAALMIDGGFMLVNRGQAQAAADAGALAGARSLCDNNYVLNTANVQNAVTANKANPDQISQTSFKGFPFQNSVTVTASITNPTFFAKMFKKGSVVSKATATGTCLIPGNLYQVLPLAFQCQNPTSPVSNLLKGCGGLTIDPWYDGISKGSGPLYLFVEGSDFTTAACGNGSSHNMPESCNYICSSGKNGKMNCNNLMTSGNQQVIVFGGYNSTGFNRGFLPSACSSGHGSISSSCVSTPELSTTAFSEINLNDQVTGDYNGGSSFYGAIKTSTPGNDNVYLMPYFSDPPDWTNFFFMNSVSYHIIGEMGFIVTCVNTNNHSTSGCPLGATALYNANKSLFGNNIPKTIEGYFVNNLPFNLINPGYSSIYRVGVNYVSLTK